MIEERERKNKTVRDLDREQDRKRKIGMKWRGRGQEKLHVRKFNVKQHAAGPVFSYSGRWKNGVCCNC